jgi:hypothetical protein
MMLHIVNENELASTVESKISAQQKDWNRERTTMMLHIVKENELESTVDYRK